MVLVLISYPLGHQRYLDVARFLLSFWFLVTPPSSTAAPLTFRPTPLVSLGGLFQLSACPTPLGFHLTHVSSHDASLESTELS